MVMRDDDRRDESCNSSALRWHSIFASHEKSRMPRHQREIFLLLCIAGPIACSCASVTCEQYPSLDPRSLAAEASLQRLGGCYELRTFDSGTSGIDSPPPRYVYLSAVEATQSDDEDELVRESLSMEDDAYLASPRHAYHPPDHRAYAVWRVRAEGRLSLSWTNGFSHVTLCLRERGRLLRGIGTYASDLCSPFSLLQVPALVEYAKVDCRDEVVRRHLGNAVDLPSGS